MVKAKANYTPEQRAIIKRMVADADAADKARKVVDRAQAIRDGQIAPSWAEQLIKATGKRASKTAATKRPRKLRLSKQRLLEALTELYGTASAAAVIDVKVIEAALATYYDKKKWGDPPRRDAINRATGRRED